MEDRIKEVLKTSLKVQENYITKNAGLIAQGARTLAACLTSGHKILLFGNGGSAADSQHIAAEFVNRFALERPPLAAVALSTDTSILTAVGNDYGFDLVFEKQIRAIGNSGDIAWGISTSGNSPNVICAMETARDMGLLTMGFTGCGGGRLKELSETAFVVDSDSTPRIQETHILMAHILCELVEKILFPAAKKV